MSWRKWGKSKFGNRTTHHAGYSFASKLESELFSLLKLMEKNGEITEITLQPHVELTRAAVLYIADFSAVNKKTNGVEYFEAKGFETDMWRLKRRLWKHYGAGPLHVFKASKRGPVFFETIGVKHEDDNEHDSRKSNVD